MAAFQSVILAAVTLLAACGAAAGAGSSPAAMEIMADGSAPAPLAQKASRSADNVPAGGTTSTSTSTQLAKVDVRKRIVTGSLDLQVADMAGALSAINGRMAGLGAWLASSQIEAAWASLVIRVPAERYDQLVSQLGGSGRIIRSSTQAEDVTDQWFDLDNRLRSKRILQERYLTYLRQAKNVEDLMAIERQVNELTAEIEQLEGGFKRLGDQVAYSTLTVNLSLPGSTDRTGYDLGGALSDFLMNVRDFFQAFLVIVLYVVVIGTPLVLAAAVAWWLCFGRIGLVRRLFAHLSGRRSAPVRPAPGSPPEA